MTKAVHSDIGPAVSVPNYDEFVGRELAFCGLLVLEPLGVLGAEDAAMARRGLWEKWRGVS